MEVVQHLVFTGAPLVALLERRTQVHNAMSSRVTQRFKGKQLEVRCSTECKFDVETILSQSITQAKTNGWAHETLETVVECIRVHLSSKTLGVLSNALGLLLTNITVLRQSVKDVKWKEEESRAQAIFAAMCSLAVKDQPPSASSTAVWQKSLCIIVRVCGAGNWSQELFDCQLRFLKKEPVDDCRVQPTFVVGKCKLKFDWMCSSVEHEVSVRLLVHHIQNHLP